MTPPVLTPRYGAWLLLYGVLMLTFLAFLLEKGATGLRQGLKSFWKDACGNAHRPRTLGQEFALRVFGEPDAPKPIRGIYAAAAFLAYPLFSLFMLFECLFSEGLRTLFPFMAAFFVLSVLALGVTGILLLWFMAKYGSIMERVIEFWKTRAEPQEPETAPDLPVWWLYGVNKTDTLFRMISLSRPFFLIFITMLGTIAGFLGWLGEPHSAEIVLAWTTLVLWLLIGWLLPLDAALKIAPWRGDGHFSRAVLDNALRERDGRPLDLSTG